MLGDDEVQSAKSRKLFDSSARVLITDVVLAETLWILGGGKYKAKKERLVKAVEMLLQDSNINFEDNEVVSRALEAYRISNAGFADALIVHKAAKTSAVMDRFDGFYTFDIDALQLPYSRKP